MAKRNNDLPLLTRAEIEEIDKKNSEIVGLMVARSANQFAQEALLESANISLSHADKETSRREGLPLLTQKELKAIDDRNNAEVGQMIKVSIDAAKNEQSKKSPGQAR